MGSAPPQPTLTSRIQLGAYGPVTCSLRRPSHRGAHSILTAPPPHPPPHTQLHVNILGPNHPERQCSQSSFFQVPRGPARALLHIGQGH